LGTPKPFLGLGKYKKRLKQYSKDIFLISASLKIYQEKTYSISRFFD
jgi:hypothetical protein